MTTLLNTAAWRKAFTVSLKYQRDGLVLWVMGGGILLMAAVPIGLGVLLSLPALEFFLISGMMVALYVAALRFVILPVEVSVSEAGITIRSRRWLQPYAHVGGLLPWERLAAASVRGMELEGMLDLRLQFGGREISLSGYWHDVMEAVGGIETWWGGEVKKSKAVLEG